MDTEQCNKDIAKSGVLLVRRDRVGKERFAVLWAESANGERKARLELYGDDRQFMKRKSAKKMYNTADMTAAVEEASDGISSFVIVMRHHEALRFAARNEHDRQEWLLLLQEFINRTPSAHRLGYDHVWHNLRLLPLELGAASGLAMTETDCSFAFNAKEVAIIRPMHHTQHFTCTIKFLRSCGSRDNCVSLSCGRRAPFGEGRIYLRAASSTIAREIRASLHAEMVRGANVSEPVPSVRVDVPKIQQAFPGRSLPPTPGTCHSLPGNSLSRDRQHGNTISLGQLSSEHSRQFLPLPKPPSVVSSAPQPHRPRATLLASSYSERPAILRQLSEPVKCLQRSHTIHGSPPTSDFNGSVQSLESSCCSMRSSSSSFNAANDQVDGELAADEVERQHDMRESVSSNPSVGQHLLYSTVYEHTLMGSRKAANREATVADNVTPECCRLPAGEMPSHYNWTERDENRSVSDAIPISSGIQHGGTLASRCSTNSDGINVEKDSPAPQRSSNDCEELFNMETGDTLSLEPQFSSKVLLGSHNYLNVRASDRQSFDSGYSEPTSVVKRKEVLSPEITYGKLSFSPDTAESQGVAVPQLSQAVEARTTYDEVDFVQTSALKAALQSRDTCRMDE